MLAARCPVSKSAAEAAEACVTRRSAAAAAVGGGGSVQPGERGCEDAEDTEDAELLEVGYYRAATYYLLTPLLTCLLTYLIE